MEDPPQVQILAHRDRRQLCLVDANEPANVLITVTCTTERGKSSSHRQLSRLDRRMPSQRLRSESRSQGDERGGLANSDARNEMSSTTRPGRAESQGTIERDSLPTGGTWRSGHDDNFDLNEEADCNPEKQKAHLTRVKDLHRRWNCDVFKLEQSDQVHLRAGDEFYYTQSCVRRASVKGPRSTTVLCKWRGILTFFRAQRRLSCSCIPHGYPRNELRSGVVTTAAVPPVTS
eukprot:6213206-Pleurochrysis_carterae.AAC.2